MVDGKEVPYIPEFSGKWNDEWLERLRNSNTSLPLRGQVIVGKIIHVDKRSVLVDTGYKVHQRFMKRVRGNPRPLCPLPSLYIPPQPPLPFSPPLGPPATSLMNSLPRCNPDPRRSSPRRASCPRLTDPMPIPTSMAAATSASATSSTSLSGKVVYTIHSLTPGRVSNPLHSFSPTPRSLPSLRTQIHRVP